MEAVGGYFRKKGSGEYCVMDTLILNSCINGSDCLSVDLENGVLVARSTEKSSLITLEIEYLSSNGADKKCASFSAKVSNLDDCLMGCIDSECSSYLISKVEDALREWGIYELSYQEKGEIIENKEEDYGIF